MPYSEFAAKISPEKLSPEEETMAELYTGGDESKKAILVKYWEKLREMKEEVQEKMPRGKIIKFNRKVLPQEAEEAQELVNELVENGIEPIISIPEKYRQEIETKGIKAKATWIPRLEIIAGTLGVKPYRGIEEDGEKRILTRIKNVKPDEITPRFTGPQKVFSGIIAFRKDFIPPERIEML